MSFFCCYVLKLITASNRYFDAEILELILNLKIIDPWHVSLFNLIKSNYISLDIK